MPKNTLSAGVKAKIKSRAKKPYVGKKGAGSVFARSKQAAKTGTKLGGRKLKAGERAPDAKVLSKTKSGPALVKARKARSLARQAAKAKHRAAWERGQKAAGKKIARPKGYLKKNQ